MRVIKLFLFLVVLSSCTIKNGCINKASSVFESDKPIFLSHEVKTMNLHGERGILQASGGPNLDSNPSTRELVFGVGEGPNALYESKITINNKTKYLAEASIASSSICNSDWEDRSSFRDFINRLPITEEAKTALIQNLDIKRDPPQIEQSFFKFNMM